MQMTLNPKKPTTTVHKKYNGRTDEGFAIPPLNRKNKEVTTNMLIIIKVSILLSFFRF